VATRRFGLLVIALLTAVGCRSSIGVKTVPRDQFDYAEAMRDAAKEQMLLNLVGLRYAEAPMFLKVTSVISNYTFEGGVAAAAPGYDQQSVVSAPLQISGKYSDRPTITYLPLSGAEFTRSVLTPIPPQSIMSLIQAGWQVDTLFRLTVRAVNGVGHGGVGGTSRGDEQYYELVSLLGQIQEAGGLAFRVEKQGDKDVAILRIGVEENQQQRQLQVRVREILDLDPTVGEYRLVFGRQASAPDEIAMLTRSVLEMLAALAQWVDVPPEYEEEGRVMPRSSIEAMKQYGFKPMISVHSSTERPHDAFVAVRYEGLWYWINNQDFSSKRTLSFMQLMFSLAESSGGGQKEPVVTVQAGG
jgi:hypothetical protein